MLNSPKLKLIVYILINLIYNFNTIFVAAIPFMIDEPKFLCEDQVWHTFHPCKKNHACSAGTVYQLDMTRSYSNFITALGLECDDGFKITLLTMFAFGANWAGSFIFNVLGDRYGRLRISQIGFVLACSLYLLYLPPITYVLVAIYMLAFGFLNAYFLQAYILGVEFTSSHTRDFYTIVAQSFDGLMGSFTVLVFTFTRNYKVFMIAGFTFGVIIGVCMFLFVPESPRFFVANGRNKRALHVYKYLAQLHPDKQVKDKIALLEERVNSGLVLQEDKSDDIPFSQQLAYFVKTKTKVFQAVIVSLCWFVNCLQNYGLNLELGQLQGDILINAAISNVTGFFACFLSYPVLLYAKRKPAQILGFTLTAIASAAYNFADNEGLQYFLLFCIKFGIALTFILIYCFTTELYPTQIRGLAFGLANTFGRLATIMSALMVNVDASVFMWMNVGQSLLIIVLTFALPETKGLELVDKMNDHHMSE